MAAVKDLMPQDGMGIRNSQKQYHDAIARHKKGPWRTNSSHPLYVPKSFRVNLKNDSKYFSQKWFQHAAGSTADKAEVKAALAPFPVIRSNGDAWEQARWQHMANRLNSVPHGCEVFGPNWATGFKFELHSMHLVYQEDRYDKYAGVQLQHDAEDVIAFHGTSLEHLRSILKHGFDPTLSKDGWYGNGVYFTDNLPYSQHYINFRGKNSSSGIQMPAVGHVVYVLGCYLRPGKVKVVPPDTTPLGQGYQGPYRDKGCEKGFHSHAAWVTPQSDGKFGFRPVKLKQVIEDPKRLCIKEFVIFESRRALPRYIIGLRRVA